MNRRLPNIRVETRQRLDPCRPGFLALDRRRCVLHRESAALQSRTSSEFEYDSVLRRSLDAAVVVAHCVVQGEPNVYLRSCVRPPIDFRKDLEPDFEGVGNLWELPAGLIDESGPFESAARACAARELHEEVGFDLPPTSFQRLGPIVYPLPAMIAERQVFFQVEVDPEQRGVPLEDGSPLEADGRIVLVPLGEALAAVRAGDIPDSKTELGLRRFEESWRSRGS